VDRRDRRVRELRGDPGLVLEPAGRVRVRPVRQEGLDGNVAAEVVSRAANTTPIPPRAIRSRIS
jgi:hypothetical protein